MDRILYILALVCLVLDTLNVPTSIKWFSLAAAFLVASLVF